MPIKQQQLLALVGQIEEDMVNGAPPHHLPTTYPPPTPTHPHPPITPIHPPTSTNHLVSFRRAAGFPFTVPAEYADLPQLLGRAEVEMTFT